MSAYNYDNIILQLDEDGFMENPEDWDIDVASALAHKENINELTDSHLKIIDYLRDYFKQYGAPPMIGKLCRDTGFSLKQIYNLFPTGPTKGAFKIAGLPKPSGCMQKIMSYEF